MKTKLLTLLTITSSIIGLASCNTNQSSETYKVIDTLGREVYVPTKVEKVLCIGASALRLYSYVGNMDLLCGIEKFETLENPKLQVRPYSYAYDDLFKTLPAINSGGPMQPANAEAILSVNPDVVFSLYNDVEKMNALSSKINKPVVCLSYGNSDPFSNQVIDSIKLIGKITNNETRSEEFLTTLSNYKEDLNNRTKNIEDKDKPSVYLSNNTYNNGAGNFGDSLVDYTCFKVTNAKNVLANKNYGTNNPSLDFEEVISLNPEMVFVDVFNISKLQADFKKEGNKAKYMQIDAFKNNNVYIQMPFNQYYTNLDIAIADSYFIGKTMFPEKFEDINLEEKYDEICSSMLRVKKDYYKLTLEDTKVGFSKLDIEVL